MTADLPKQGASKGRFQKGVSGNPSGRRLGSRNKASLVAEALLEGQVTELTQRLIGKAMEGNTEALRLVFERLCPPRKDRPATFHLPDIETLADIAKAQSQVTQLVAAGDLTPAEGASVMSLVEARRRTIETVELEARIAALEALQAG